GLVGDDDLRRLLGGEALRPAAELGEGEGHVVAGLALLERLADAEDGGQARCEGGLHLGAGDLLVLAVVLAALGVADGDVGRAQGLQHRARDLARVGAGLVGGEVLGTVGDRQLAGVDGHLDGADVDERWQHDDLDLVGVEALELLAQLLDEREALLPAEAHPPGARHQRAAGGGHWESSSRMEMPGRSLPSMSSRLAPAPVEMCEKRDSSTPRVRTAAAESPPPTTV